MPYAVAAAAISAGGAAYQSDQAKSAANQQVGASKAGVDEQRRQFGVAQGNNAPFLNTGTLANQRLATLLGLPGSENNAAKAWAEQVYLPQIRQNMAERLAAGEPGVTRVDPNWKPDDATLNEWAKFAPDSVKAQASSPDVGSLTRKFTSGDLADPVYSSGLQFGLDEGEKAINARATQAGNFDSGATLKALTRFGNDYGSTKANESYNRFTNDQNNVFNRLSGISGTGQVASSQVNAAGTNAANNITASLEGAGNARAAGIVGGANAWGNAGASTNSAINNYQNNELLKKLLAQNNAGGSSQTPYFSYSGYDSGGGAAYG